VNPDYVAARSLLSLRINLSQTRYQLSRFTSTWLFLELTGDYELIIYLAINVVINLEI